MVSFFPVLCVFQVKIELSWRNYLIGTAAWGCEYNIPDTQNTLITFLSVIAVMQVIFWTEDHFWFISDCRDSFNCKLKKLINEHVTTFYSLSNALCSFDEPVQIKNFKHHTFIDLCSLFTWFNLQILNFC